jgi:hypothetical protein
MHRQTTAFTDDQLAFIQTAATAILVAAATGRLDLGQLARLELAHRGLDHEGQWVGFDEARAIYERSRH